MPRITSRDLSFTIIPDDAPGHADCGTSCTNKSTNARTTVTAADLSELRRQLAEAAR